MMRKKREIVLLCTAITLGTWVFLQIGRGPAASVQPLAASVPVKLTQPAGSRFELAGVEDFDEIVERPLFAPTRRPVPVAIPQTEPVEQRVATPRPAAPRVAFELTGVVIDGAHAIVLLTHNGKTNRVRYGDAVAGWRLETVEGERVVLERGAQQIELELRSFAAPSARTPARSAGTTRRSTAGDDDASALTEEEERAILERLSDEEKEELIELLSEESAATEDVRSLRPRSTN